MFRLSYLLLWWFWPSLLLHLLFWRASFLSDVSFECSVMDYCLLRSAKWCAELVPFGNTAGASSEPNTPSFCSWVRWTTFVEEWWPQAWNGFATSHVVFRSFQRYCLGQIWIWMDDLAITLGKTSSCTAFAKHFLCHLLFFETSVSSDFPADQSIWHLTVSSHKITSQVNWFLSSGPSYRCCLCLHQPSSISPATAPCITSSIWNVLELHLTGLYNQQYTHNT